MIFSWVYTLSRAKRHGDNFARDPELALIAWSLISARQCARPCFGARNKKSLFTCRSADKENPPWGPEAHPSPAICYVVLSPLGAYIWFVWPFRNTRRSYATTDVRRSRSIMHRVELSGRKSLAILSGKSHTIDSTRCPSQTHRICPRLYPLTNLKGFLLGENANGHRYSFHSSFPSASSISIINSPYTVIFLGALQYSLALSDPGKLWARFVNN